MEIVNVKIRDLKFAEYNPREITEHDYEALKNAIKEFGIVDPIIVNKKENQIIGGHMRVRAAQELGMEEVPVYYIDLPENRAKILNLALNRIQGRWNREKLEKMIYDLSQAEVNLPLTGFEDWELEFYNPGPIDDSKKEWIGMPAFEPIDDSLKIIIHFENEANRDEFIQKYAFRIAEKGKRTWSTWYPFKEKVDESSVKYE